MEARGDLLQVGICSIRRSAPGGDERRSGFEGRPAGEIAAPVDLVPELRAAESLQQVSPVAQGETCGQSRSRRHRRDRADPKLNMTPDYWEILAQRLAHENLPEAPIHVCD